MSFPILFHRLRFAVLSRRQKALYNSFQIWQMFGAASTKNVQPPAHRKLALAGICFSLLLLFVLSGYGGYKDWLGSWQLNYAIERNMDSEVIY